MAVKIEKADKGWQLTCDQFLERPVEEVFDFFQDAMNLEKITPPFLNFKVLTEPPIEMREGTLLDYRIKLHGIPIRWRTEINTWEPPFRFCDQQLRGPYRWWIHTHTFEARDGGTLVKDHVKYGVPGGTLINRFFVEKDVRRIFEYRTRMIEEVFAETNIQIES